MTGFPPAIRRASGPAEALLRRLPPPLRGDYAGAALLAAACVGLIAACSALKTRGTVLFADPGWDRHQYIEMARSGAFDFHLAPYCWRVAVPFLASLSPLGLQASFLLITFAAVWAAGAALYVLVRRRGHQPAAGVVAVLLFYSLGWGPKFILADFWIPDGLAFFLLVLALGAALERRAVAFAIVLALAAPTKESVLLAAPLFYTLNARRAVDPRLALQTVLAAAPAAAIVAALRIAIGQENGNLDYLATLPGHIRRFPEIFPEYNYRSLLHDIGYEQRYRDRSFDTFLRYTTGSFGVLLPLLALIGLGRAWRFALRLAPFLILTYAQLLFATDTQRLIVFASPALILAALEGVRTLDRGFGVRPAWLLPPALASFALVLLQRQEYAVRFESQALVVLAWVVVLAWRRVRVAAG